MFLDVYNGGDEIVDGEEEFSRPEFICPFCAEDFDVVGLCCHIDEEHAVEVKNGVRIINFFFFFGEKFYLSLIHSPCLILFALDGSPPILTFKNKLFPDIIFGDFLHGYLNAYC